MICDVNGDTLALIDAVRGADGLASRIDRDVPLIVLTARADELARVRLYERGGDDVIAKPFGYPELRARVRALLRRSHGRRRASVVEVGALRIDTVTREVQRRPDAGRAHRRRSTRCCATWPATRGACSPSTSCCATCGASAPRAAPAPWTATRAGCDRSSSDPGHGRFVENVWGVGYRLAPIDPRERDGSAA